MLVSVSLPSMPLNCSFIFLKYIFSLSAALWVILQYCFLINEFLFHCNFIAFIQHWVYVFQCLCFCFNWFSFITWFCLILPICFIIYVFIYGYHFLVSLKILHISSQHLLLLGMLLIHNFKKLSLLREFKLIPVEVRIISSIVCLIPLEWPWGQLLCLVYYYYILST